MPATTSPPPSPTDIPACRLYLAGEAFRSIQALASDARNGQWVHKDTAEALDQILEFAVLGERATTDEDEGAGDDGWAENFPP